ncbi:MAG: GNAT family N-acetyltransferase [Sphaerochaetaceae bacterium]|nr:GNAT family N-acetyltransferase [Bacteroidales bacterium]MDD4220507.1 GNAT family N-acetyltransferase [Sphaerochaetaceae bacterium]
MELENLIIEDISRSHERDFFSCGIGNLDNYLKFDARRHHNDGINHTKILTQKGMKEIIGYFSCAAASVTSNFFQDKTLKKIRGYEIPCIKLTRFAIDRRYQGRGLGQYLLICALKHVCKVSENLGAAAVIIDAKNSSAKEFYIKNGFYELSDLCVYLPIREVRRSFKL